MNKHNIDNQAVTYHFNFIFNGNEYNCFYGIPIRNEIDSKKHKLGNNSSLSGNNNANLNPMSIASFSCGVQSIKMAENTMKTTKKYDL